MRVRQQPARPAVVLVAHDAWVRHAAAALLLFLALALCVWPRVAVSAETAPQQAAATPAPEAPAGIPLALPVRRDETPAWQTGGVGVFGALATVMAVFGLVVWLLWRIGWADGGRSAASGHARKTTQATSRGGWRGLVSARAAAQLRVVESARLTPRASVHVVQWNGQQWLLGCAEQGVTVIAHGAVAPASSLPSAVDDPAERARP